MITKYGKFICIVSLLFLVIGVFAVKKHFLQQPVKTLRTSQDSPKATPATPLPTPYEDTDKCVFEITVPDLNTKNSQKQAVFTFCQDFIYLSEDGREAGTDREARVIETKQNFPELFEVQLPHGTVRTPQTLTYKTVGNLGTVVEIQNTVCWGHCSIVTVIYLLNDMKVQQIFKSIDNERVSIYQTHPLILRADSDLEGLGCGSCFIPWSNFYQWNPQKNQVIGVNNQYPEEMKKLLAIYEQDNRTACKEYTSMTLEQLYRYRNGADAFCDNEATPPAISSAEVKVFLQARRTLQKILKGENLSNKDIENQDVNTFTTDNTNTIIPLSPDRQKHIVLRGSEEEMKLIVQQNGQEHVLLESVMEPKNILWSPDSTRIAFVSGTWSAGFMVEVIDVNTLQKIDTNEQLSYIHSVENGKDTTSHVYSGILKWVDNNTLLISVSGTSDLHMGKEFPAQQFLVSAQTGQVIRKVK